ncbi:MAG: DUF1295 domain-containing protein [Thiolinea sp.]
MFDWTIYLNAGLAMLVFALAGWVLSLIKKDVSIVDSMWSLMILLAGTVFFLTTADNSPRRTLAFILLAAWAIRLSAHITWAHWGDEEDYRYQRIRANNEPNFTFKSIYIVFGLQAFLGWLVALPLMATSTSDVPLGWLDYIGVALWLCGMFFESVGDYQMARFKADPDSKGKVYDQGLWRYTRHPNYFGECVIWWGFFLIALSAGGWWSVLSPLLMTFLLLKVSGVAMLEQDIGERRPAYAQYIKQTNAFIPWFPRRAS